MRDLFESLFEEYNEKIDSDKIKDWKGSLVKVKPEWMNPGERDIPYLVIEDQGDRVLVQELKEYARKDAAFLGIWCWSKKWCYIIDDNITKYADTPLKESDSNKVVIGYFTDPKKENYIDTEYAESPKYDEDVEVIGGQTVPVVIYPYGKNDLGHSFYWALKTTDNSYLHQHDYIYNIKKYILSNEITLVGWHLLDTFPYLEKDTTIEEAASFKSSKERYAHELAQNIFNLIPNDPQNDKGEFDKAIDYVFGEVPGSIRLTDYTPTEEDAESPENLEAYLNRFDAATLARFALALEKMFAHGEYKFINESVEEKWTLVKEDSTGEHFWDGKAFTVDFKNRGNANYQFNTADEAKYFIKNTWPWETRKNATWVILPYSSIINPDEVEHKLI